ncbi:endonuclease-reverse transcriptase, partial [Schistosoma japonicum]
DLLPGASLTDLEYADDIVLFGEDADKMQSLLTTLSNNASMFGMRFSPSKCKMLLQDWVASAPELMIESEVVERVDRFTYLGSLISADGLVTDEISARIQKARLAFAKLRHLWRRRDIRLLTKGRVYRAAVRSVLLYGSETWPLRVEDIRRLLVFDHRCLRNIARVSWDNRVSNAVVRKRILGKDGKSINEVLKLHQLRWLGHVLRMSNYRLPRRAMFCGVGIGWKKARGGQTKTWQKSMNHLSKCRLPGWDPRVDQSFRCRLTIIFYSPLLVLRKAYLFILLTHLCVVTFIGLLWTVQNFGIMDIPINSVCNVSLSLKPSFDSPILPMRQTHYLLSLSKATKSLGVKSYCVCKRLWDVNRHREENGLELTALSDIGLYFERTFTSISDLSASAGMLSDPPDFLQQVVSTKINMVSTNDGSQRSYLFWEIIYRCSFFVDMKKPFAKAHPG